MFDKQKEKNELKNYKQCYSAKKKPFLVHFFEQAKSFFFGFAY